MPSTWQTVRVFISSTFRDMHAERDHLIKVTFPALREKLLPYRVELYDIDLRWGITEDEAKNEKVISLCLEQVDECHPFFLAFLSHRYGWVPSKVPDETMRRFPFIAEFPGVSVTELEIRHGALLNRDGRQTLVLLRQDESVAAIPAATRQRDFVESDPQQQAKLDQLKRELQSGSRAVQPYGAVWDPKRYDRVNRTEGRLTGLDEFGRQVEQWLWEAIKQKCQLPETPAAVEPLDAEADLHERFLELRTRIYVGRDELYRQLEDFSLASGEQPLLLTGESGLGKSAALARFVRDFRMAHPEPEVVVIPHFVGASPGTTSLTGMLQRLTQELARKFGHTPAQAESTDEVIRAFNIALASIPASARVVLVFDALNQLDADERADTLIWLPEKLPSNVRVLCSSTTGPQQAPRVLASFAQREHVERPVKPLTNDERRAIVRAVPKLVAKTLDDRQIDALLANPATQNPLFLMVALEELRGYGSYERLNEMIAGLPCDGDAVTSLFDQLFVRLEEEFNKPLVESMLRFLACSRRGLSGAELTELTQNLGDQADDLYPVLRQLRAFLQVREGLFDFYHLSIRRAVEIRYLQWRTDEDQRDPWKRWNTERQPPASDPTEPERESRHLLINYFAQDRHRLTARAVDELPWQLAQLRSWQRLFDLLGDLAFFAAAWQANEFEVRTAWSLVKAAGGLEPIEAYRSVLANPTSDNTSALWKLALYLHDSGHGPIIIPLWSFFIDHFRATGEESRLSACLGNQASILQATGDLDGAMRLLKEQEAICQRLNLAAIETCLGNQAVILRATGDLDGAMRLHKEEEAICRRLNDPAGLHACLGNQAVILQATGDLDGAMRLHKEQEAICRRLNDPAGLGQALCGRACILQATGDLVGAMRLHKEQEAICRRLNDPASLETCLGNQAVILRATGDLDGAMRLHKEEEAICRRLNDPAGLHACLGNQAVILQATGDLDGAMRLHKEQEAICRRLNDPAGLGACLGNQALILQAIGDLDRAMRLHKEEEAIWRRLNNPASLGICLGNQAVILQATGDLDGAMRLYKEEEAICRRLNDPEGLAISLINQAHLLAFKLSRPTEALPLAEEALRQASSHGLTALVRQIEPILQAIRRL